MRYRKVSNEVRSGMDVGCRCRVYPTKGKRTGFLDVAIVDISPDVRSHTVAASSESVQAEKEAPFVLTFSLNRVEQRAYDHFAKHRCSEPKGPLISVRFTPVGVGTSIQVECHCGKLKDISDVHSW